LSEKINDGSLKPEDKINEQQISDALEISRTPIREALIQLAAEGYLESIPRKGFRVRNLDYNKAKELYEIIGLLDGRIAYLTIDIISEEDIRNMEFLADSMTAAIEQDLSNRYYELQVDFHNTYINLCKNQEMINLLNQLKRSFLRKYYVFGHSQEEIEILKETNQEHYEIIRLFKEKKKEELERYIRDVHWSKEKAIYDSL
jgi:DNA-binding GntR family transcriptional regulator